MLETVQNLIKTSLTYVIKGLKNAETEKVSAKCLKTVCKNNEKHMHDMVDAVISGVLPKEEKDWKFNQCQRDILSSVGVLLTGLSK